MQRTITGDILVQHLGQDAMTIDRVLLAKHGRSARTLAKDGPLRLTLMALAPGGNLPAHSTDSPVSIHVVQGEVSFYALDQEHALATGDVLILAPGVEHAARSVGGATLLLTVAYGAANGAPAPVAQHTLSAGVRQRWSDDGGHPIGSGKPAR